MADICAVTWVINDVSSRVGQIELILQSSTIVVRCRLSVSTTRVHCDKTTTNRITQLSPRTSGRVSTVSMVSIKTKFEGGPVDRVLDLCSGGFWTLPNRSHRSLHTYIWRHITPRTARTKLSYSGRLAKLNLDSLELRRLKADLTYIRV